MFIGVLRLKITEILEKFKINVRLKLYQDIIIVLYPSYSIAFQCNFAESI